MSKIRNKIFIRIFVLKCCRRRILASLSLLSVVYFLYTFTLKMFNISQHQLRPIDSSREGNIMDSLKVNLDYYKNAHLRACVHPEMKYEIANSYNQTVLKLECNIEPDWTEVSNGSLMITDYAWKTYNSVRCQYSPIIRPENDDDNVTFGNIVPLSSKGKVDAPSDYFRIACKSQNGSYYGNVHATIVAKEKFRYKKSQQVNSNKLNVLMFGFDTVSRIAWKRFLPETHLYFTQTLGGIVLEGYNIVGDGTPQALLPILTGKQETELSESRRGFPNATTVDSYPWIWKKYERAGYVTQWAEDMPYIGTFNLRMKGFNHTPVHHYMRPYFLITEKMHSKQKPFCFGSQARHKIMMNWVQDSFTQYSKVPKFIFAFHSEYSHGDYQRVQMADRDMVIFLKFLNEHNDLNNTVLILMSDHGPRFLEHRKTLQGKLEERMPYFAFSFPSWFRSKYPTFYHNFLSNSKTLTTPYDIHKTLRDILHLGEYEENRKNDHGFFSKKELKSSYSLFDLIPADRTCAQSRITPHWCACLKWEEIPIDGHEVIKAKVEIEQTLNEWTEGHRSKCYRVNVTQIHKAYSAKFAENLLKFKKSQDKHGRIPEFSEENIKQTKLQITFETVPGNGLFEATVDFNVFQGRETFSLSPHEISRINMYGNQSNCIVSVAPHLRPYCVCMEEN